MDRTDRFGGYEITLQELTFWELTFREVDILGVDILRVDILRADILRVYILEGIQILYTICLNLIHNCDPAEQMVVR